MVFVLCGLFLKGMRWITKLLYMFCSMLFQVKIEKILVLEIKGMHGKNTEGLQKPFKYFAIIIVQKILCNIYSVGKKMRLLRLFSP